jgi:hypothetical protein
LLERYELELQAHVVGPPPDSAAPERARLVAYSRRDAALLAHHYGLDFRDPGAQPSPQSVTQAAQAISSAGAAAIYASCEKIML